MKLAGVMKEYVIQEKKRKLNLKKSIATIRKLFRKAGIKGKDYVFRMNIEGNFHYLNLRDGYDKLQLSEIEKITKLMESTSCKRESCHPAFYEDRVCVALTCFNLEKLCAFAEQAGCMRDVNHQEKFFYLTDKDTIFFFRYLPDPLLKEA